MDLSNLKANPKNPRKVTDKKLSALKKSLQEFGDLGGIVFNKRTGQIVGGHQRLEVFKKLGKGTVVLERKRETPTKNGTLNEGRIEIGEESFSYREVDWDEAREKAANIAANKGAGEWDLPQLGEWFAELKGLDFDLDLTMFDEDERKQFFKDAGQVEGLTDPDEIPEQVDTRCKPGDLWLLGNHRILCGDSTDVLQVERLMGGEKAQTFFTDPPYGDNVGGLSPKTSKEKVPGKGLIKRTSFIANDNKIDWLEGVFNLVPHFLEAKSTKMVFFKWDKYVDILNMAIAFGKPSALCVWDRVRRANNFFRFQPQHELCLHWGSQEDKKESLSLANVWHEPKEMENKQLHPTVKPIAILEPAIRVTTNIGSVVLDLFLGSGSTLIACEKTSRRCFGMELDPEYCDTILSRWEKFTGKTATLQTGEDQGDEH